MAQSMVGPLGEIHDATTAEGSAALFGFVGVEADRRDAVGGDLLTRTCVEQLADCSALMPRAPAQRRCRTGRPST